MATAPSCQSSNAFEIPSDGLGKFRPVRMALLGLNFGGGIARHLIKDVKSIDLAGVCDMDEDKAKILGNILGVRAYADLEEILEDSSVEAVGLFTGPFGRADLISKILGSGRHVMTTKPFEIDVDSAERVLEQARKSGLVVHLNSPTPTPSEDVAKIQDWIQEHDLGMALAMSARTWACYREKDTGSWYDNPSLCPVAPILRLGIYFLNDFAPLLGTVNKLWVQESRLFTGRPTADHAQVSLCYENGAIGSVFASFCVEDSRPYRDEIVLNYERGSIYRWTERCPGPDMSADYALMELHTKGKVFFHQTRPGAYAGWYQWNEFARAIRLGSSEENNDQILYGLRLLRAIQRSSYSGLPEGIRTFP